MKTITKIEAADAHTAKKLRVAAYARVSTSSDEQLISLDAQKNHYEVLIRSHKDWEFAGLYFDEGISGTKMAKRDGLLALLDDCEKGKIDYIIVKSISRFSRNTVDSIETVRRLCDMGIYIFFEKENIDTGKMEGELLLSILSSLAESESRSISDNETWSIKRRFMNGTFKISYPPYGYDYIDGEMVVNEKQSEVVKWIFGQVLSGNSTAEIARKLNEEDVPTRRGGSWTSTTINGMIRNEKYTGDVIFQKTYTVSVLDKKRSTNNGQRPKYYVEGSHEAIISKDVFMRVQSEIARRANLNPDGKRRVYSSRYALSGMVYCGHCGDIYRRVKWNNRGCKSTVWRCVSRVLKKDVDFNCPARTVKEEVLQGAVLTAVNDAYARKNIVTALLKQNVESTVYGDLEERLTMADKELADLQAQMISVSGDEAAVNALGEQIDGLRTERQSILAEAANRSDLQERMNDMIFFLDEMPQAITEYSDAITRRLVEKITILDEKIVVELKSGLQMEVEA